MESGWEGGVTKDTVTQPKPPKSTELSRAWSSSCVFLCSKTRTLQRAAASISVTRLNRNYKIQDTRTHSKQQLFRECSHRPNLEEVLTKRPANSAGRSWDSGENRTLYKMLKFWICWNWFNCLSKVWNITIYCQCSFMFVIFRQMWLRHKLLNASSGSVVPIPKNGPSYKTTRSTWGSVGPRFYICTARKFQVRSKLR